MRAVFAILSLVAYAAAYQVTSPSKNTVWSSSGSNTVSWSKVDTDADSFAAVLVNQDRSALPTNNVVLSSNVDGTKGSISVSYPQGSWPTGSGFQVNFVKSATDLNTILAQSEQFSISSSGSSASGSTTSGTSASGTTGTGTSSGSRAGTTMVVSSTGGNLNPTSSDTSTQATSSNAALPRSVRSSAMGILAFAGALLF